MWAIPWLSNVRLAFYRADRLQRAGCAEPVTLRLPEQFEDVLQQLQQIAEAVPLTLATRNTVNSLHNAALWVWGANGHFIAPGGKQTQFNEPAARRGLHAYFSLHRYLVPVAQGLDDQTSDRMFLQGQTALTISDPGLLYAATSGEGTPVDPAQIRTALPPGVPFVGGSNLVVWRHTHQEKLAFELVKFLTSPPIQTAYNPHARSLPVRLDALDNPPFSTDPLYQPVVEALKAGRSYQINRLWGMVEERLIGVLNQIWEELFAQPNTDVDALLDRHLPPLAERLNQVLSSDARR